MEIHPTRQLALFAAAFLSGVLGCVLLWLLAAFRVILGAYTPQADLHALYERPLPLLARPVRVSRRRAHRAWCVMLTACCDVVFCLALALSAVLLFYEYNDGTVRPFVLVVMLVGLVMARLCTARMSDRAVAYLGFFLAAARTYLAALALLPCRGLAALLRLAFRPSRRAWRFLRAKRYQKRSAALCRKQLALAQSGLDPLQMRKEVKDREEQERKAARGRARHSHSHSRGGVCVDRAERGTVHGASKHPHGDRGSEGADLAI